MDFGRLGLIPANDSPQGPGGALADVEDRARDLGAPQQAVPQHGERGDCPPDPAVRLALALSLYRIPW